MKLFFRGLEGEVSVGRVIEYLEQYETSFYENFAPAKEKQMIHNYWYLLPGRAEERISLTTLSRSMFISQPELESLLSAKNEGELDALNLDPVFLPLAKREHDFFHSVILRERLLEKGLSLPNPSPLPKLLREMNVVLYPPFQHPTAFLLSLRDQLVSRFLRSVSRFLMSVTLLREGRLVSLLRDIELGILVKGVSHRVLLEKVFSW